MGMLVQGLALSKQSVAKKTKKHRITLIIGTRIDPPAHSQGSLILLGTGQSLLFLWQISDISRVEKSSPFCHPLMPRVCPLN